MDRLTRGLASVFSVAAFTAGVPSPASAEDALEDLLIEKGLITEAEIAEARSSADGTDDSVTETSSETGSSPEAEAAKEAEPKVDVRVGAKGLVVRSPDGRFKAALGGRMQWDFGGFTGSETPLGAGTELRRGRIKSYGTVYGVWDYKLEVNFDPDGDVSVTDGWIRYSGFDQVTISLGHQKVPFSQQSMTSSNWQVFQERAQIDAFIDTSEEGRRRVGGIVGSYGSHWNASAGFFAEGIGTSGTGSNEDWGTASRVVAVPMISKDRLLTLGGSVYYRKFEQTSSLRYKYRPEAHLADTPLVDTGTISDAESTLMFNAESSFIWGPVHAQGEYTSSRVERAGRSTVRFDGWYAQAGYFITGESRNFAIKSAKFKRIKPSRKIGAWELAVRYSKLDLEDEDILGGRQTGITAGLNWWVNQNIMFRFNYVRSLLEPNSSVTLDGIDEEVNSFMGRAQIVF